MKKIKALSDANKFRTEVGCRIVLALENEGILPVGNVHNLARKMQSYFMNFNYIQDVKEHGYKWVPSDNYWKYKMSDICKYLRSKYHKYFGYIYEPGTPCTDGVWKMMSKDEWEAYLRLNHMNIGTRIEEHNDKLSDSKGPYDPKLPRIKAVAVLSYRKGA